METNHLMEEEDTIFLMNVEDYSCSPMMGISTKEWYDIPSIGLMFYQNSSQAVFKCKPTYMNPKKHSKRATVIPI